MLKNIKLSYWKLSALLCAGLLSSCEQEVEDLGMNIKPTMSVTQNNYNVTEGQKLLLKFKIDRAIKDPMEYKLVILSETNAKIDEDFIVDNSCLSGTPGCGALEENGGIPGYIFTVPAMTENFELPITIVDDFNPESDEKLRVKVIPRRNLKGFSDEKVIDITITNKVTNEVKINFDWTGEYLGTDNQMHDFCDLDLDLELYNSANKLVKSSYTGCPEELVQDFSSLANGNYFIAVSLWSYNGKNPVENQDIPFKVTVSKQGKWNKTNSYNNIFTTGMPVLEAGNDAAFFVPLKINKNNDILTLYNENDEILSQGKISSKFIIPSKKRK